MNDQGAARKQSQGTESGQIIIKMRQCVAAKGNIKIGSYFVKKFFHRVVLPSFYKSKIEAGWIRRLFFYTGDTLD